MAKYKRKPVIVEARQLTKDNMLEIKQWCGGELIPNYVTESYDLAIITLDGVMMVELNDFVIRGTEGEFYPCSPRVFEKTYEEVG